MKKYCFNLKPFIEPFAAFMNLKAPLVSSESSRGCDHSIRKNSLNLSRISFLLFLMFLVAISERLPAQITCGIDNSCLINTSPGNYKCINGFFTIEQLYTNNNPTGQPILLDPINAQNTPQFVIVNGLVTFNQSYSFASGSEIVFGDGSEFVINSGISLNLQGSYLHGCSYYWNGITVNYGGKILMNGNTIEDALQAIRMVVDNSSVPSGISATDNIFRKNYFAIHLEGLQSGLPRTVHVLAGGIAGNTFDGSGQLPGSADITPFCGIYLENIKPITVGVNQSNPNIFQDYDGADISGAARASGIFTYFSGVNIVNSYFIDIGKIGSGGLNYGVYAIAIDDATSLSFQGLGGSGTSLAAFVNVSCPIRMNRGNLSMKNVRAVNTRIGLYYGIPVFNPSPVNIEVKDCLFENYAAGGCFFDLNQRLVNKLSVQNCQFNDGAASMFPIPVPGFMHRYAVALFATQLNTIKNLTIRDNLFINVNKNFSSIYNTGAIFLRNIEDGLIEENTITDYDGLNTQYKDFRGIRLENCTGLTVRDNSISGSGNAYATNKTSTGIDIFESGKNLISCNVVDRMRTAISFAGENCDLTTFKMNNMYEHDNGLLLAADAVIGKQIMQDNRWYGPAPLEGNFVFVGFDPTSPAHINRVGMSKFEINTADQNTVLWANPRIIGSEQDNDYWFEYDPALPPAVFPLAYFCPVEVCCDEEELSESSLLALEGNYPAFEGFAASTWEAEFRLYRQLHENPNLRPAGSAEASWYNAQSPANLGQLYAANESAWQSGNDPALLNPVVSSNGAIANLLDQLYAKDEQIAQAQNPADAAQLLSERSAILEQLEAEQANYVQSANTLLANTEQQAATAATNLGTVNAANTYEQNLKDVLQIQLALMVSGQAISISQQTALQNIAAQCRYEGGLGVLLARLMLDGQTYDDAALCSERGQSAGQKQFGISGMRVQPNPAHDRFLVGIDQPFEEGFAILHDALGRTLGEQRL